jgi:hypothetical protein
VQISAVAAPPALKKLNQSFPGYILKIIHWQHFVSRLPWCDCIIFLLQSTGSACIQEPWIKLWTRKGNLTFILLTSICHRHTADSILANELQFHRPGPWGCWWPQLWNMTLALPSVMTVIVRNFSKNSHLVLRIRIIITIVNVMSYIFDHTLWW